MPGEQKKEKKDERIRVCVCTPMEELIPSKFVTRLLEFINRNRERYILFINQNTNSPVDKARNELVHFALVNHVDLILFLDADNLFTDTVIDKLFKVMIEEKADLVTGIYFQKGKPYNPLIREYKHGGFFTIENPPLGKVIKIDGCGMGCVLIKAEVFKKLKYPWFKFSYETWGKKEIQLSEDLYFCREMMRAGMKLVCDTGVISPHIGSTADIEEYLNFGPFRQALKDDTDELMADLEKYTKKPEAELVQKLMMGQRLMREEWNAKKPKKYDEIKQFYKETENYLYDLTHYHLTERRQTDIEKTAQVMFLKPKNVIDFGCGIGQQGLMLARKGIDVTLADLKSKTLDFAKYRFETHKVKFKIWETDIEDMPPDKKYDVILALDVLEHIPKHILKIYVEKLIKLKHKNTKVITELVYGRTAEHPMHHDMDVDTMNIIKRLINEVPSE